MIFQKSSTDGKVVSVFSLWHHWRSTLYILNIFYVLRRRRPNNQIYVYRSFSLPLYYLSCLGDRVLGWAVHDFLWYFLGLAVMVVDKDQINAPYMQKWRSKGIRVITSPVNRSLERLYFEKQLRLTCMADTMDEIGIDKLLEDNWTYLSSQHVFTNFHIQIYEFFSTKHYIWFVLILSDAQNWEKNNFLDQ